MFRIEDRFVWDFWTIEYDGLTWLYALTAPRDPDPETRHDRARVVLATSEDLTRWTPRGEVLAPGAPGAWDDLAIWTGSVARDPEGGFVMLYTGRGRADGGRAQKIGLARSDDLVAWTKHPDPVLEVDPAQYRPEGHGGMTHWRDPELWKGRDGIWRAWITAQHPDGPEETSGCVALAESRDLIRWTVRPPATDERLASVLEVPQMVRGGAGMLLNVGPHHVPTGGQLPKGCLSLLYRRQGDIFRFDRVVENWPTDSRYVVKEVRPGVGLCWQGHTDKPAGFEGVVSDPFGLDLSFAGEIE